MPENSGKPIVRVSWTGNGVAELDDRISITKAPGSGMRVIMSFGTSKDPDESLPDLRPGDLLEVSAELEVTTDLTPEELKANGGKGCASKPYAYAPKLHASLLLAKDAKAVAEAKGQAVRIGATKTAVVDHHQHHWVIVFDRAKLPVPSWWSGNGVVNLVLDASNPEAASGHCLLVGQNEPDGTVGRDMSAISVCRLRPAGQPLPGWTRSATLKTTGLKIREAERAWKVIYSMPLDNLTKDEQLRVHAKIVPSTKQLGLPARLSTRIFLADAPDRIEPDDGYASRIASSKGRISKINGTNCLPDGKSPATEKIGVMRVAKSADKGKRLYLNVVGVGGDPAKKARPGNQLALLPQGFLEMQRFAPSVCG